jgi:hypothetical protein
VAVASPGPAMGLVWTIPEGKGACESSCTSGKEQNFSKSLQRQDPSEPREGDARGRRPGSIQQETLLSSKVCLASLESLISPTSPPRSHLLYVTCSGASDRKLHPDNNRVSKAGGSVQGWSE